MNLKKFGILLFFTFLFPLGISLTVGNDASMLVKPALYPPNMLFPIVWSIWYVLMTIGVYLSSKDDDNVYIIYFIQVVVNSFWTLIFFGLKLRLFAFIWLILLLVLVVIMSLKFYKNNKIAGYLQIPYINWILFAGYLNLSIYLLNH